MAVRFRNWVDWSGIAFVAVSALSAWTPVAAMAQIYRPGDFLQIESVQSGQCLAAVWATGELTTQACAKQPEQRIAFANRHEMKIPLVQYFHQDPGPLMAGAKCLAAAPVANSAIMLAQCDGSAGQFWTYDGQKRLKTNSGMCMDLGAGTPGAPVLAVPCSASRASGWSVTTAELRNFVQTAPAREAFAAQQRQKATEAKKRWDVLWAIPNASRAEQEEMERLAGFIDSVLYLNLGNAYLARYPTWNWAQIERMCRLGHDAYCARIPKAGPVIPSYNFSSGSSGGSSTVTVRTYDQYGNYTGSSAMSRTEAELRGAK